MGGQTGPKRTKAERERDIPVIADMYVRGKTQEYIASWLAENRTYKLSRVTILNDLKKIKREWLASAVIDYDEAKAKELAKIDKIEFESWEAWERSIGVSETQTISQQGRNEEDRGERKAVVKRENKAGDPRFLSTIQWCINKRCEILGLDAPKKQEWSGPDGKPLELEASITSKIDLSLLPSDDLKQLRQIIGACRVGNSTDKQQGPADS